MGQTIEWPEKLTAGWLREQYTADVLTPEQVVREIIDRAERDAEMNIWIEPPSYERIRPYVQAIEQLDPDQYPLWGIPFAVKDNIDIQGIPTTAACPDYAYTPDEHASVVARLIEAGAIPVGKSNLDQFATGLVGVRSPFGAVHNALKPEYISGGSSSGSAVAVARGQAVFGLGTDTAGSGRVPAALNDLVGFKPTRGAWPIRGVVPACASLDCVTVFAHNLDDAFAVDRVVRGVDEADPWSRRVERLPAGLPEKLLLPASPLGFYGPHEEEYRDAWEQAKVSTAAVCEKAGISVEYVDCEMFFEAAAILYEGPWLAERWSDLGAFVEGNPGALLPVTERILSAGSGERHTAASLFQAIHRLRSLSRETERMLQGAVLVLPTCGGTWTREQVELNPIRANSDMGRYTNHCNLLDLSAIAIPAGKAAQDLPFGITLFARPDGEHLLAGTSGLLLGESFEDEAAGAPECITVAVCGLHMRGFPLEKQMREHGASFGEKARTAPRYELVRLPTEPPKPGLIKKETGSAIELELWNMPAASLGSFVSLIPAPLGLGRVELEDGREVTGFICEGYAEAESVNISAFGGWRYADAALRLS